ncbi:hypothetical protein OG233_24775 [Streptomyces sp. NBC_01218]|uniref:WXG100-like domain-containing protein n=1 Tax=Streptomyces sp. NBC_01218 TaxID=2903780 RepID=UPI002E0EBDA8|nr:hypothetical protein OG233_24775 [Streptomyces sp. NBC_01218]
MLTPSPQAQELMKALTGMEWPSINEDELREAADLYESTAEDFDTMRDELAELARYIRENFSGEAAQAFVRYAELLTGGEAPALSGVKDQAANLAHIADDTATDAEYVKWMILAQMIELIAEMIFEAAVWWVPGLGQAVTAHVSLLTMLVRLLVPRLIRALVRSIAVHTAISVAMGLAMDALIQGVQMAMGNRETWSTDATIQALAYGAVQGLVGGATSFAGAAAGARIGRRLGSDFTKILTQEAGGKIASLAGSAREGRRLADGLAGTLGGMNADLAKGLNKSADESLAEAFVRGTGDQFARSALRGMSRERAREVGTTWARTVLREWTGPGSATAVSGVLREELAGLVRGPALRVLADDLPDAMSKAGIGPSKGFLLGQYGTDMLFEGVSQNLSEGAYNVLTTGQFTTTGGTFLSGFLTTGVSHAGRHFVVRPLMHELGQDHAWVQKLNDRLAALDGPEHGWPVNGAGPPASGTDALGTGSQPPAGYTADGGQDMAHGIPPGDDGTERAPYQEPVAPRRTASGNDGVPAPPGPAPVLPHTSPTVLAATPAPAPVAGPPQPRATSGVSVGESAPVTGRSTEPAPPAPQQPKSVPTSSGRRITESVVPSVERAPVPRPLPLLPPPADADRTFNPNAPVFGGGPDDAGGPHDIPEPLGQPSQVFTEDGERAEGVLSPSAPQNTNTPDTVESDPPVTDARTSPAPSVEPDGTPFVPAAPDENGPPHHLFDVARYETSSPHTSQEPSADRHGPTSSAAQAPRDDATSTVTPLHPGGSGASAGMARIILNVPGQRAGIPLAAQSTDHVPLVARLLDRLPRPIATLLADRTPQLAALLGSDTESLLGDGRTLFFGDPLDPYVATLTLRLGEWRRIDPGALPQPYKFDTIDQHVKSRSVTATESRGVTGALTVPLAGSVTPTGTGQVSVSLATSETRAVELGQAHMLQRETRAAEATETYVMTARLELEVERLREDGSPSPAPATSRLTVRDGATVEVPVGARHKPTSDLMTAELPHGVALGSGHVEGFGPVGDLPRWAARGAGEGQTPEQIHHFFSSHSLRAGGTELLKGTLDAPRGYTVGGLRLGAYHPLSLSTTHEMRDSDQFTQSESVNRATSNKVGAGALVGVSASAGPARMTGGLAATASLNTSHTDSHGSSSGTKTVARIKNSRTVLGLQEISFVVTRPDSGTAGVSTWVLVRQPLDDVRAAAGLPTDRIVLTGDRVPDPEQLRRGGDRAYDLTFTRTENLVFRGADGGPLTADAFVDHVLASLRTKGSGDVPFMSREEWKAFRPAPWYKPPSDRQRAFHNTQAVMNAVRPGLLADRADQLHNGGVRVPLFGRSFLNRHFHTLVLRMPGPAWTYRHTDPHQLLRFNTPGQVKTSHGRTVTGEASVGLEFAPRVSLFGLSLGGSAGGRAQASRTVSTEVATSSGRDNALVTTTLTGTHVFEVVGALEAELVGNRVSQPGLSWLGSLGLPPLALRRLPKSAPIALGGFDALVHVPEQRLPGGRRSADEVDGDVGNREPGNGRRTVLPERDLSGAPLLTSKVRTGGTLLAGILTSIAEAAGNPSGFTDEGGLVHSRVHQWLAGLTSHPELFFSPDGVLLSGVSDSSLVRGFEGSVRLRARRTRLSVSGPTMTLEPEQNTNHSTAVSESSSTARKATLGAAFSPIARQSAGSSGTYAAHAETTLLSRERNAAQSRTTTSDTNLVQTDEEFVLLDGDIEVEWAVEGRPTGAASAFMSDVRTPSGTVPWTGRASSPVHLTGSVTIADGYQGLMTPRDLHALGLVDDGLGAWPGRGLAGLVEVPGWMHDDSIDFYPLATSVAATPSRPAPGAPPSTSDADSAAVRRIDQALATLEKLGVGQRGRDTLHTLVSDQSFRAAVQAGVGQLGRVRGGEKHFLGKIFHGGRNLEVRVTHTRVGAHTVVAAAGVGDIESTFTTVVADSSASSSSSGFSAGAGSSRRSGAGAVTGGAGPDGTGSGSLTKKTAASTTRFVSHLNALTSPMVRVESEWETRIEIFDADGTELLGPPTPPAGERSGVAWTSSATSYVPLIHLDPPGTEWPALGPAGATGAPRTREPTVDWLNRLNEKGAVPGTTHHIKAVNGADKVHSMVSGLLAEAAGQALPAAGAPPLSSLTKPGRSAAQALAAGLSPAGLAGALADGTALTGGYRLPGLSHRGFFGGTSADVTVHMAVHYKKAVIRRMSDSVRLETYTGQGTGHGGGTTESSSAGLSITGAVVSTPGDAAVSALPRTGAEASAGVSATETETVQRRINEKPLTGRALLIGVPVTALAEVTVERHFKDGTLGGLALGKSPATGRLRDTADLTVDMWITEAQARELGILDAEGAHPRLKDAWDAVNEAQKAVKDNSVAYEKARLPVFKRALRRSADGTAGQSGPAHVTERERLEADRIRVQLLADRFDASVNHYQSLLKQAIDVTQRYQQASRDGRSTGPAAEPPLVPFDRGVRHDHEPSVPPDTVAPVLSRGPVTPTVMDLPIVAATDAVHVLDESPEAGFLLGALQAKGLAPSLGNLKEGGTLYVIGHDRQVGAGGGAIDEIRERLGGADRKVKDFTIHMVVCKAAARQGRTLSPAENFALTLGNDTLASTVDVALHARDRNGEWVDFFPLPYSEAVELGRTSSGVVLTGDVRTVTSESVMDELIRQFQALGLEDPAGKTGVPPVTGPPAGVPVEPAAGTPDGTTDPLSDEVYDVLSPRTVAVPSPAAELEVLLAERGRDVAVASDPASLKRAEDRSLAKLKTLLDTGGHTREQIVAALGALPEPPFSWLLLLDPHRVDAVHV